MSDKNITVGIDYSMSCPAMCICTGDIKFENCEFYFLTDTKKYTGRFLDGKITGVLLSPWQTDEGRYNNISNYFIYSILKYIKDKIKIVNIEGYAMGAKGQVFNIGENTGLLKHKLFTEQIPFKIIAPTAIKKSATGKGGAKKQQMYETFQKETSVDLKLALDYTKKDIDSPIGDIVDSFYICKHID